MKRLQVKYCYSDKEANDFLKTLEIPTGEKQSYDYYKKYLVNVQYMAKVHGDGIETESADKDGVTARVTVGNDVIAIIQYFVFNYEEN